MNLEPLITLIQAQGLSAYQSELLKNVCPAIALHLEPGQAKNVGQSRIGGVPDLPTSMAWLKDESIDRYLNFLLQINLAELPSFTGNPFPRQGMLYLFAADDEEIEQFVMYTGDEALAPATLPDGVQFATDWCVDLIAHRLTFSLFADLPRWSTTDYNALCDSLQLNESLYNNLTYAIDGNSIGKLLGHVAGIGHDPRENAYIVREVNPEWMYSEQRRTLDMTGAKHWCNLLQVNSSDAVDLMIGDAGYLQLLVHDEDLKQLDFSRIYINVESS